jgi:hypothetical protein
LHTILHTTFLPPITEGGTSAITKGHNAYTLVAPTFAPNATIFSHKRSRLVDVTLASLSDASKLPM